MKVIFHLKDRLILLIIVCKIFLNIFLKNPEIKRTIKYFSHSFFAYKNIIAIQLSLKYIHLLYEKIIGFKE